MKFKSLIFYVIAGITIISIIGGFLFALNFKTIEDFIIEINERTPADATQKESKYIDTVALYADVLPPEGVTFPGTWQNIGPKLVHSGAIDLERLKALYEKSGRPMTEEQIAFFAEGSNVTIHMTPENSQFILNILWALGLVNKNDVLSKGPIGQLAMEGYANSFASTKGWILGVRSGGELLNSAEIITLTPEQQAVVESVANNSYRPCCNNPTAFPDCNHGAAALGLAELLASQGANEEQVIAAVKAANSMWFPQQYLELALYFKATKGKDWNEVDPWKVVGQEYSSSSGRANVRKKVKEMVMLPQAQGNGTSCAIRTAR